MEMLQGVWKQHLRPCAVVGYGVKIFLPSPPNYVTRSPGHELKRTYESIVLRFSTAYLTIDNKYRTHIPDSALTLNESFSRLRGHIEQATSDNTRRLLYWKNFIDDT